MIWYWYPIGFIWSELQDILLRTKVNICVNIIDIELGINGIGKVLDEGEIKT